LWLSNFKQFTVVKVKCYRIRRLLFFIHGLLDFILILITFASKCLRVALITKCFLSIGLIVEKVLLGVLVFLNFRLIIWNGFLNNLRFKSDWVIYILLVNFLLCGLLDLLICQSE
jgi:hypothetical protein